MNQQVINLYDEYIHQTLTRQEFLKRLTLLTGSTVTAMSVLPLLENNYAKAAITSAQDLFTEDRKSTRLNSSHQI
jgi:carboxymethylenebutenolidase